MYGCQYKRQKNIIIIIITVTIIIIIIIIIHGCHCLRKFREKQELFKVREKSGNFLKSQWKSAFIFENN